MAGKIDRGRALSRERSPRDTYITVFGRMPVLEALNDRSLDIAKIVVADNARGENLDRIVKQAHRAGVEVQYASAQRVKYLAGNGKQDQGIVADVVARRMAPLSEFISARPKRNSLVFVLDGITNPSNVGMILRAATAAGIDGIVLPRVGSPPVGPLVIKASAGVAFRAPIITCATAVEAVRELADIGYAIFGLSSHATSSIYDTEVAGPTALVLGGETYGVSPAVRELITDEVRIPMSGGVESLNVATAGTVVAFEFARRRESARETAPRRAPSPPRRQPRTVPAPAHRRRRSS